MSCNCNPRQIPAPNITPTLAAGSVASPYYFLVNITQRLCHKTCATEQPVFNARFSLVSFARVGVNQYVATVNVQGIISYVRCGGGCDCTEQQPLNANFTIPFGFTGTPANVAIAQGATINSMSATDCAKCSKIMVSETPITLTVSATA